MPKNESIDLNQECETFCRYLTGTSPSEYILSKYRDGHKNVHSNTYKRMTGFDRFVVFWACRNRVATRLLDSYVRIFDPSSVLRKKLILLLAILESSTPQHQAFEEADLASTPIIYIKVFSRSIGFMMNVLISVILFAPIQVLLSFRKSREGLQHG